MAALQYPDLETLTRGLTSLFTANGCIGVKLIVVDRKPNGYQSTFPSEIVTCRFHDSAARLYLHFRWLEDRPEWTTSKRILWRFKQMRSVAEQLGLI